MKTVKSGRVARNVPISLSREQAAFVEKRVADLGSSVSSRSHYIQRLIDLDQKLDLLGRPDELRSSDAQLAEYAAIIEPPKRTLAGEIVKKQIRKMKG